MSTPERIQINADNAAFPVNGDDEREAVVQGWGSIGLTKREYFAGLALQALLANPAFADQIHETRKRAEIAVKNADAILVALEDPRP